MNRSMITSSKFLFDSMKVKSSRNYYRLSTFHSAVPSTFRSKSLSNNQSSGQCNPPSSAALSRHSSAHACRRSYHSFPDPKEKPVITTHFSTAKPQLEKTNLDLSLNVDFKMNAPYPNYEKYNSYIQNVNPKTFSTVLKNGLTIASEDRYSLMTTLAFVVKTGRYDVL